MTTKTTSPPPRTKSSRAFPLQDVFPRRESIPRGERSDAAGGASVRVWNAAFCAGSAGVMDDGLLGAGAGGCANGGRKTHRSGGDGDAAEHTHYDCANSGT